MYGGAFSVWVWDYAILGDDAVRVRCWSRATAKVNAGGYIETDLVTDLPTLTDKNGIVHTGKVHDPNLVNPWGVAESPTSPFWIADNNAGVSTLYNVPGTTPNSVTINPRVVSIPTPVDLLGRSGTPTGAVFNITTLPGSTRASPAA